MPTSTNKSKLAHAEMMMLLLLQSLLDHRLPLHRVTVDACLSADNVTVVAVVVNVAVCSVKTSGSRGGGGLWHAMFPACMQSLLCLCRGIAGVWRHGKEMDQQAL
jgi:hypothetical protein